MSNHTPGPWWIGEPYEDDEGYPEIPIHASIKGVPNTLLTPAVLCLQFEGMEGMQKANARLIATAPDLLAELDQQRAINAELVAALKYWLPVTQPLRDQFDPASVDHKIKWNEAKAALAKAGAS